MTSTAPTAPGPLLLREPTRRPAPRRDPGTPHREVREVREAARRGPARARSTRRAVPREEGSA
jgi:hypothetical protein